VEVEVDILWCLSACLFEREERERERVERRKVEEEEEEEEHPAMILPLKVLCSVCSCY